MSNMINRIRQIMEDQHLTQQSFADFIQVSPASLRSKKNERTRPTLQIVEKIKSKIPNINTDWLMFGSGSMYTTSSDEGDTPVEAPLSSPTNVESPMFSFEEPVNSASQNSVPRTQNSNSVRNTRPEIVREEIKFIDKPQRHVTEIRVYYDDQTWESFVPAKK